MDSFFFASVQWSSTKKKMLQYRNWLRRPTTIDILSKKLREYFSSQQQYNFSTDVYERQSFTMVSLTAGTSQEENNRKYYTFCLYLEGLKADVKGVCKPYHVCQMSRNSGRKKFRLEHEKIGEIAK